jgi:hypothetical protein
VGSFWVCRMSRRISPNSISKTQNPRIMSSLDSRPTAPTCAHRVDLYSVAFPSSAITSTDVHPYSHRNSHLKRYGPLSEIKSGIICAQNYKRMLC